MKYIGIDLGASFIKAALLDTEAHKITRICKRKAPSRIPNKDINRNELDPVEVRDLVLKTIQDVKGASDIDGILISNQMHGFIIVDNNGLPVTNYITWQDRRGADAATLSSVGNALGHDGQRKTGMPLIKGLPSANLYYVRHHEGIKEGHFLSLGDYISFCLCGNTGVHPGNCAGSGLMDLEKGNWNFDAIENMDCSGFHFPRIAEDFTPIGTCEELDGAKVFPAFGDQQVALLGVMLDYNEISINIGTGSQVSRLTGHREYGNYQLRPFFSGQYLKTVTHIPAGRALNVIVEFSKELVKKTANVELDTEDFWKAFGDVDYTTGGLNIDLSFFPGSATGDSGSIENITEGGFDMNALLAGAYRRMASNYFEFTDRVGKAGVSEIIVSGGLINKNRALLKAITDKFTPLKVTPRFSEDTLVGLYIIALSHELNTDSFFTAHEHIKKEGLEIDR
jgi:sugar (pentulose or hexulose) kinase